MSNDWSQDKMNEYESNYQATSEDPYCLMYVTNELNACGLAGANGQQY